MARRVVERHIRLQPLPESARTARRTVVEALTEAGASRLADSASLLVSELVTNAILHARTSIDVTVSATPSGLRVGVADRSAALPSRRDYGSSATTGRGLELVDMIATRHGTDTHGDGTKTVWFELGVTGLDPQQRERIESTSTSTTTVRLEHVPLRLARAWQQHTDALLREYLLACWDIADDLDNRVAEQALASDAVAVFADAFDAVTGPPTPGGHVDLTIALTGVRAECFELLNEVMDRVVVMAERDELLAPPTQPEIRLLRRWLCDEVRRQSGGALPTAWGGLEPATVPATVRPVDWDTTFVDTADDAMVAADDANRIIAASDAALELLGWSRQELVGQRIVRVIPAPMRESHIAAFTHHLLTGTTTILDRHVEVPALRSDGTEVMVDLEVRRAQAGGGRAVFVATMRSTR